MWVLVISFRLSDISFCVGFVSGEYNTKVSHALEETLFYKYKGFVVNCGWLWVMLGDTYFQNRWHAWLSHNFGFITCYNRFNNGWLFCFGSVLWKYLIFCSTSGRFPLIIYDKALGLSISKSRSNGSCVLRWTLNLLSVHLIKLSYWAMYRINMMYSIKLI